MAMSVTLTKEDSFASGTQNGGLAAAVPIWIVVLVEPMRIELTTS